MRSIIACILALTVLSRYSIAQIIVEDDISIGKKITITSKVLSENRHIMIYSPKLIEPNQQYQVVYLLDGEYLFTSTVGIVDALVTARQIPPTIIVGIETTVRVRDYLPPIAGEPKSSQQAWIKRKFPLFGGTSKFTDFLQTELFPYIESEYSVLPTKTLIGYSNGGVYGLHTLVNSPDIFTNYLLISPAAWWGEQEIDNNLTEFSKNHKNFAGNLYLTVAGEGKDIYSNAMRIASKLETIDMASLNWTFQHLEDESHQSTIYPSIYQGLIELYGDLYFEISDQHGKFSSIDDVKNYYSQLSKRYGYEVTIPEVAFSDLADKQFLYQRSNEAIDTLKSFVKIHSSSSFAHSDLGRGYMRTKQFELAKVHFDKAIQIVKNNNVTDKSVLDFLQDMANLARSKM